MAQWNNHPVYKRLNLTIYTCNRPVNFLKQTVADLNAEGAIPNIQHGSKLNTNWEEIPQSCLGIVKQLDEAQGDDFAGKPLIHRANRNLAEAFLMPDEKEGGRIEKDILILEDDVSPCKNLLAQLQNLYTLIDNNRINKYIIALYSCYDWGTGRQAVVPYPIEKFYGLQATIFSGNIRTICHNYHYRLCAKTTTDFITKIIATENRDIGLFASRFSLFQHTGSVTTGLGGNFHRTANFIEHA